MNLKLNLKSILGPKVEMNRKYSEKWPVITTKKEPPKDWKQWDGVPNKYKDHFSEKPGTED